MNQPGHEHEFSPEFHGDDDPPFLDTYQELLPGIVFEESAEMREARIAILEALKGPNQDPDFLQSVWVEYAKVCEETVDHRTPTPAEADSKTRARIRMQLQIAVLVHKALICREMGDLRRYGRELTVAEDYALTKQFDEVARAIGSELDDLERRLSSS